MNLLEKELDDYEHLTYEKVREDRFCLTDNQLEKEVVSVIPKTIANGSASKWQMEQFHNQLEATNDFSYVSGHGYYLDGYSEFGIIGFMDETPHSSFEMDKRYRVGNVEFEVGKKSDLFHFLTWFEDKSKVESNTLKLYGVTRETYSVEVEKVLFYLGNRYRDDILAEHGEFSYPRILDIRGSAMPRHRFEHTKVSTQLDWTCPVADKLMLFNRGESTATGNFYWYYRFIESLIGTGGERGGMMKLVKSVDVTHLLEFAKETLLVKEGTPEALVEGLIQVKNDFLYAEAKENPLCYLPVTVQENWRVVVKELSIILLNKHCTPKVN